MKSALIIILFLFSNGVPAQDFFTYKISKPYCLLNFMNTATDRPGTSSTLKKFIDEKTAGDLVFRQLCEDFSKMNLHYYIARDEFPESRMQNRSTYNLLAMNAVNAKSLSDFKTLSIGILPLSESRKLIGILSEAEKIYDAIIWNDYSGKLKKQLRALEKFKPFNAAMFKDFAVFYDSSWSNEIPFQVAVYPIPGKNGNTTATPHINTLCVGVLTDETDYDSRNSVILHEMCHVLFNEQSAGTQNKIDKYFNENPSPYAKIAYSYFDEALATALGNGWAYQKSSGKTDKSEWYNNPTIDGFAKALYPTVENYLNQKKTIDKAFVETAVNAFSAQFPTAIYDYKIALSALVLYTDATDYSTIRTELKKHFQVWSFDVSSPILHHLSIERMNDSKPTQFFVIDQNHQQTLAGLKDVFPELTGFNYEGKPHNLSFVDAKGRTVVLLLLRHIDELPVELQKMKEHPIFDSKHIVQN